MVIPTLFVSGTVAVLHLCKEVYLKYKLVKRYRADCHQLCQFVHRVEKFLLETEDEADVTQPGWQAAFTALHETLVEVAQVFDDCARYGIVRSLINADDMNMRLSSIAQRMTMALQLIPIQKAKVTHQRMCELQSLQHEIHTAQFTATRAAEQQSAQLKRLMDQSRSDAAKSHEMIYQVLLLLQQDRSKAAAAAAAAGGSEPPPGTGKSAWPLPAAADDDDQENHDLDHPDPAYLDPKLDPDHDHDHNPDQDHDRDQILSEVADLKEELLIAHKNKKIIEEQYLTQVIAAVEAMEQHCNPQQQPAAAEEGSTAAAASCTPPADLLCPITFQLLEDPVMLVDSGQTYERDAIQEWLSRGNNKDPVTGVHLESTVLVPNVLVKKLAREWADQHPEYRAQVAAAAAAAAQHDACLPAEFVVNRKDSEDDDETAAAVAAAAAGYDGSSSRCKPVCCKSSVAAATQQQQQGKPILDEKAAARSAYAAAVAAAAAAGAPAVTYPAIHVTAPPSFGIGTSAAAAAALPGSSTASATAATIAAAAFAGSSTTQPHSVMPTNTSHRRASHDSATTQYQQQQQQVCSSSIQQQQHTIRRHSADSSTTSTTAAAAGGRTPASLTMDRFRTTFNRMSAARREITMKHGNKLERIVEIERQQQQEQLEKQQLQQQIDQYKQQYQQLLEQQQQDDLHNASKAADAVTAAAAGPTDSHDLSAALQRSAITSQAPQDHPNIVAAAAAGSSVHSHASGPLVGYNSLPAVPSNTSNITITQPMVSHRSTPHALSHASSSSSSAAGSSSSTSLHSTHSDTSKTSHNRFDNMFGSKKPPRAAAAADDDTCSVASGSSSGSSSSRKHKGRGVLSALKKLSYTMIYEDDKC